MYDVLERTGIPSMYLNHLSRGIQTPLLTRTTLPGALQTLKQDVVCQVAPRTVSFHATLLLQWNPGHRFQKWTGDPFSGLFLGLNTSIHTSSSRANSLGKRSRVQKRLQENLLGSGLSNGSVLGFRFAWTWSILHRSRCQREKDLMCKNEIWSLGQKKLKIEANGRRNEMLERKCWFITEHSINASATWFQAKSELIQCYMDNNIWSLTKFLIPKRSSKILCAVCTESHVYIEIIIDKNTKAGVSASAMPTPAYTSPFNSDLLEQSFFFFFFMGNCC